jgi:hypothetical protein
MDLPREKSALVTGRGDEIQQRMHPIVPEPRVTLDPRLLRQNVVVLALQVVHDLLEPARCTDERLVSKSSQREPYANSLSTLSPNPGVSTTVSAMRTPSSSSSAPNYERGIIGRGAASLTDVNRLDPDLLLYVGVVGGVEYLVGEHLGFTEGVDKGGAAVPGGT